jgi:hypothetical protein
MDLNQNFAAALNGLGSNAGARIANGARPPANYLFNSFLPERQMPDYHVDASEMVVRSTMAGLVGMDSPYPPGATVEIGSFLEQSAKLAISSNLNEASLRRLQSMLRQMQYNGTLSNDFLAREALNFFNKVVVQAQLDRAEWMRGQALSTGMLNWTFNQKALAVDYGVPAANKLTPRTDANNDSYSDTGSKFWDDLAAAQDLLRYNVRAGILNSATLRKIINNPANNVLIMSQTLNAITVTRYKMVGGTPVNDRDSRFTFTFIIYDEEAEVLDTTAGATFGSVQRVKFMPDGKIVYIGANTATGYRVGQGGTDSPRSDLEIGYHHVAPTVEGGGQPGRWGRMYTPEGLPMNLRGEGASNELPVLLSPDKICIASTEMLP